MLLLSVEGSRALHALCGALECSVSMKGLLSNITLDHWRYSEELPGEWVCVSGSLPNYLTTPSMHPFNGLGGITNWVAAQEWGAMLITT